MLTLTTKDQLFVLVNCLYSYLHEDKTAKPDDFIELTFSEDGVLEGFSEPIPATHSDATRHDSCVTIQSVFDYAEKRDVVPRQTSFVLDGQALAIVYPNLKLEPFDPPTPIMLSQISSLVHDKSMEVTLGLKPFDPEFVPSDGSTILVPHILSSEQHENAFWQSSTTPVRIQWMQAQL